MPHAHGPEERRVLVFVARSKDAVLARDVLEAAGIPCRCCRTIDELHAELELGAGALLLGEEAVLEDHRDRLLVWLEAQPPWSDLPIVVVARPGVDSAAVAEAMDLFGNVAVLERPTRKVALVSAMRTALRARQRQYQIRNQIAERVRSEAQLQDFFENATIGMHWVSSDGTVLRANRTELAMLGYARDEYVGHPIADFFVDRRLIEDVMRRLKAGDTLTDVEAQLRCKDGTIKDVLINASVLWQDGKFVHSRSFTRDVTDRKRIEEALKEANRRKDEFLAVLAHELRNPLATIRNSLNSLRLDERGDPTARRAEEMMERQFDHIVRLVDDLLDVSRITRGKIELRKEPIAIDSVVRSAVEANRTPIETMRHRVSIASSTEPLIVEGDPIRLVQVLSNLVNNAAKYTDEGGRIWIRTSSDASDVVISVRDSGRGISKEALSHVFEMFAQGDGTSSGGHAGLGIGLTIVKSLVQLHGGSVEALSEGRGAGSEFVVRLPRSTRPLERTKAAPARPANLRSTLGGLRILAVDDDRDSADSLQTLLRFLGADAAIAYDGESAIVAMQQHRPSVVLMDLGMPGMDGFELARRIRARDENRDVVLVAVTGWGQEDKRRRSQEAGFNHHLVKPVDLHALYDVLASIGKREEREPSAGSGAAEIEDGARR